MKSINKNRRFVSVGLCAAVPALIAISFSVLQQPKAALAAYTVVANPQDVRGKWQGWGCSLSWWSNALGEPAYKDLYADLFFTRKNVNFLNQKLPGLGFNIVRYNVGGGGQGEAVGAQKEAPNAKIAWYKDIDGYWLNPQNSNPASKSWDWTRDDKQRAMLKAAQRRGADTFEIFSNSPTWWMMDSNSSAGGQLLARHRRDHARYMATVVERARKQWGVPISTVEPFNEPSAGWWNYPVQQEGSNIPKADQAEVLRFLREELDARKLQSVQIAASDENAMTQAISSYEYFQKQPTKDGRTVADLVNQVNVHAYSGLEPWRDNNARQSLRALAGNKRLWMSEYGDNDGSGMVLAQTITEDILHLRPSAWVYWQPVEPYSAWGFVNTKYADSREMPDFGKPAWVYTKYFVMAQFSRFLRPGHQILGNNDHNTVVAYDAPKRSLVFITVNYGNAQQIDYDLSAFKVKASKANITATNTDGSLLFKSSDVAIADKKFTIPAQANSIYSITVEGVDD